MSSYAQFTSKTAIAFVLHAVAFVGLVQAEPSVPGTLARVYASVADPVHLAFSTNGVLFLGRDASGSGGGNADAAKIHRVGQGGAPVSEFGDEAIWDPDALIVDESGAVSGVAGSVLVGGVYDNTDSGYIRRISPDGSVSTLFGPTDSFGNPSDFDFDADGRLLFVDYSSQNVMVTTGNFPTVFASMNPLSPSVVCVDSINRVWVSGTSPNVRIFGSDGSLVNAGVLASPASPLARGPGGFWGTDMYAVNGEGELLRIDPAGHSTVVGSGFDLTGIDLDFHGDALYVADFNNDRVLYFQPLEITDFQIPTADSAMVSWTPLGTGVAYTVEGCTNLPDGVWEPVAPTNQWPISNAAWTNIGNPELPARFFRIHGEVVP